MAAHNHHPLILNVDGYPIEFSFDFSHLRVRDSGVGYDSFPETPIVLEGAIYTLFQVSSARVTKGVVPTAILSLVALDMRDSTTSLSNGTLQTTIPELRTYEYRISRQPTNVFHSRLGYGIIEFAPVWCSNACASKRNGACGGCFSKSYWTLRKIPQDIIDSLVKKSTPPVVVYDPMNPGGKRSYILPDHAILVDYRDIRDSENRCEGGHFLPLTLAILATLKTYQSRFPDASFPSTSPERLQEIMLYKTLDNYNFLDTTSEHAEGDGWPYTRADVKKCLRFCNYTLEYIDNALDEDNNVTYTLLPKGRSFLAMFETE